MFDTDKVAMKSKLDVLIKYHTVGNALSENLAKDCRSDGTLEVMLKTLGWVLNKTEAQVDDEVAQAVREIQRRGTK
jgi:hypothetical protein